MPTFAQTDRFRRDFASLPAAQKAAFRAAAKKFVADLVHRSFRPGLRVKGIQGTEGVFEMTWASDGRATFEYGSPVRGGEAHIDWRRIGTHAALIRRYVRERLMPLAPIEDDPLWDLVGLVEGASTDSARIDDVVYPAPREQ